MADAFDLIVLGAGPAGASAASEAARMGAAVLLVDEAPEPGGQVHRAPAVGLRIDATDPDLRAGQALRDEVEASGARRALGHRVWLAAPGFELRAVGPNGPAAWRAPRLIVATGATERVIPFPGWTTPGVIGLAAATILLKAQRMLPGRRTVVAGCGPLLAAVAAGVVKGGGTVAAVVDLAAPSDWARAAPRLMARPDLAWRGAAWLARIRAAGVPILHRHAVVGAEPDPATGTLRGVRLAPVDADWRLRSGGAVREVAADALAVGHGLVPGTEVTRMLGAAHDFAARRGGWVARRGADLATTVEGLYVAGDGAGISGAAAAAIEGRLAARAALAPPGGSAVRSSPGQGARLARARRAGGAMAAMMAPRAGLLETATPDTVVCRCEDVTRAEIDRAADQGAADVNQLKSWTRAGMGPCQGRSCGEAVAGLLALHRGGRAAVGAWTARPPIRPVGLADLTGTFRYEDIVLPRPAQ